MPEEKSTTTKKRLKAAIINGLSDAILGFNPGSSGTQVSQVDTFESNLRGYLVSNNRTLLSQIYCEYGLVQTLVDVPVDDAFRGGYEIKSRELDEEDIQTLLARIDRYSLNDAVFAQACKWNRLFGGAGILIITNQDPAKPLDLKAIKKGDPLEFRAVDMWELFHAQVNPQTIGLDGRMIESEFYNYYSIKLHHSRVILLKGMTAPSFIRPRLRGWGLSVVDPLIRSINQFIKSNELIFEVLDEFKLDIFKIKNLAQTLLGPDGTSRVQQRVALANQQKNFQNAITMDADDDYVQKQLSFAGISEMLEQFRISIASDMRMPLTKLFGLSAQGFSSGEDDIENYNAMVEAQIRQKIKLPILRVLEVLCQYEFGMVPEDLSLEFRSLRILSSEQQENVKNAKLTRIVQALEKGLCSSEEAQNAINRDDLLPIKVDVTFGALDVGQKGEESSSATDEDSTGEDLGKDPGEVDEGEKKDDDDRSGDGAGQKPV